MFVKCKYTHFTLLFPLFFKIICSSYLLLQNAWSKKCKKNAQKKTKEKKKHNSLSTVVKYSESVGKLTKSIAKCAFDILTETDSENPASVLAKPLF